MKRSLMIATIGLVLGACGGAFAQDSLNVRRLGWIDTDGLSGVAVSGNYAYYITALTGLTGLGVIDILNPASPVEMGYCDVPDFAEDVVLVGNYAYVAADQSGLRVIDIGNPEAPTEVGYFDMPGHYAKGVAVTGNYAYVAYFYDGLRVINIVNPAAPVEVALCPVPGNPYDVAISGNYAYVASSYTLQVVNISNPTSPSVVGFYDTPGSLARGVAVSGNYAYVADDQFGLRIIDVSDPTEPTEVGFYDIPDANRALNVEISGHYAYVAYNSRGLQVVDISNPTAPIQTGFYDLVSASQVAVVGSIAYVGDLYGLGIYDCSAALSTPESPAIIPANFSLLPAYPNPFNPETTIQFSLPRSAQISLNIFDVQGRLVKPFASRNYGAGTHSLNWNASEFASGIYFVRLNSLEFSTSQKIVLLK